jgi:hypothetical protein
MIEGCGGGNDECKGRLDTTHTGVEYPDDYALPIRNFIIVVLRRVVTEGCERLVTAHVQLQGVVSSLVYPDQPIDHVHHTPRRASSTRSKRCPTTCGDRVDGR